ncbi:MAG: hypothetical protein R2734_04190 [Nocardioides sp.]
MLADDPVLALGRTLARAQASGAPIAAAEALSTDLARERRARAEDRAWRRCAGRAAVGDLPAPAFVLVGIVLVAGLMGSLGLG